VGGSTCPETAASGCVPIAGAYPQGGR
jgi:hypothetical protein